MLEKLLLAGTAVLLIGLAYAYRDTILGYSLAVSGTSAPTKKTTVIPANKPVEKPHHAARAVKPSVSDLPANRTLPPATLVALAKPPAPLVVEVPKGISRAEVIDRCGVPASRVTWRDSKGLHEQYLYADNHKEESVLMRNGTVVASRTQPVVRGRVTDQNPEVMVEW